MKRFLLALVLLFAVTGTVSVKAQSKEASDSAVIAQLKADQYNQLKRLVYLEAAHNAMKADMESLAAQSDETAASVQETLERLAQSERAINATLETFAQKFEDQNKTIADVQEVLDSKMNQMLLYMGVGIIAALVLMFIVAKSAAASAVKKHESNWNAFQEHLLKSK
ncbi:hypothetical protein OAT32_02275 [Schleiferiaceae bacterium]|nr:hypothetical protein [Schleiferiaceae bacterium]